MEKETLHFKIGLSGTSNKKQPQFKIKVNDVEYFSEKLTKAPQVTEYFEFDVELVEGDHRLTIEFLNKADGDTVVDNNTIIEDLVLNIDSIEVDEIDLGTLLWSNSIYIPNYPVYYDNEPQKEIKEVKNCVNLGWNGSWHLPFTSPFYIWLLENL